MRQKYTKVTMKQIQAMHYMWSNSVLYIISDGVHTGNDKSLN